MWLGRMGQDSSGQLQRPANFPWPKLFKNVAGVLPNGLRTVGACSPLSMHLLDTMTVHVKMLFADQMLQKLTTTNCSSDNLLTSPATLETFCRIISSESIQALGVWKILQYLVKLPLSTSDQSVPLLDQASLVCTLLEDVLSHRLNKSISHEVRHNLLRHLHFLHFTWHEFSSKSNISNSFFFKEVSASLELCYVSTLRGIVHRSFAHNWLTSHGSQSAPSLAHLSQYYQECQARICEGSCMYPCTSSGGSGPNCFITHTPELNRISLWTLAQTQQLHELKDSAILNNQMRWLFEFGKHTFGTVAILQNPEYLNIFSQDVSDTVTDYMQSVGLDSIALPWFVLATLPEAQLESFTDYWSKLESQANGWRPLLEHKHTVSKLVDAVPLNPGLENFWPRLAMNPFAVYLSVVFKYLTRNPVADTSCKLIDMRHMISLETWNQNTRNLCDYLVHSLHTGELALDLCVQALRVLCVKWDLLSFDRLLLFLLTRSTCSYQGPAVFDASCFSLYQTILHAFWPDPSAGGSWRQRYYGHPVLNCVPYIECFISILLNLNPRNRLPLVQFKQFLQTVKPLFKFLGMPLHLAQLWLRDPCLSWSLNEVAKSIEDESTRKELILDVKKQLQLSVFLLVSENYGYDDSCCMYRRRLSDYLSHLFETTEYDASSVPDCEYLLPDSYLAESLEICVRNCAGHEYLVPGKLTQELSSHSALSLFCLSLDIQISMCPLVRSLQTVDLEAITMAKLLAILETKCKTNIFGAYLNCIGSLLALLPVSFHVALCREVFHRLFSSLLVPADKVLMRFIQSQSESERAAEEQKVVYIWDYPIRVRNRFLHQRTVLDGVTTEPQQLGNFLPSAWPGEERMNWEFNCKFQGAEESGTEEVDPQLFMSAVWHAVWLHTNTARMHTLPHMYSELLNSKWVQSEAALLLTFFLFAPLMGILHVDGSMKLVNLTNDLYKMIAAVDRKMKDEGGKQFAHIDTIADLLYHLKYMYVGNGVQMAVKTHFTEFQPSLQAQLKFLMPDPQQVVIDRPDNPKQQIVAPPEIAHLFTDSNLHLPDVYRAAKHTPFGLNACFQSTE
ncbi:hypothetical protein Ciccas_003973 [Cichlidogyrus casuarinus]|uniref:Mediator of RNA polymerase II transcription subunit 23 n=1 Tax=Cichlidogyrus casuarinus TaxID=1844966 RepID=A0ABD2QCV0_9PLAT